MSSDVNTEDYDVNSILEDFLSKEPSKIVSASHKVNNSVIRNRPLIEALLPHLDEIVESTAGLDYGGAILSNERFVRKAIDIIKSIQSKDCLCDFTFDPFGESAKRLAETYGFVLIEPVKCVEFKSIGTIECPICKSKYIVTEEYTGWHTTTTTYEKI